MRFKFAALMMTLAAAACVSSSGAVVSGAGPDDLLKLRKGPGLHHEIIIGLPDGTRLTRHNCMTTNGKLWCRVTLTARPSLSGYVAAEYLADR